MRVVLKKDKKIDNTSYVKHGEFQLRGVRWGDGVDGFNYYIMSKSEKRHEVDARLFDFDCRDLRPKI